MLKEPSITVEAITKTASRVIDQAVAEIERMHPDYDTRVICGTLVAEGLRGKLFFKTDTEDFKSRP
jgi:hypothetical protein